MDADGTEGGQAVEERIARLEARLARIERSVGLDQTEPVPAVATPPIRVRPQDEPAIAAATASPAIPWAPVPTVMPSAAAAPPPPSSSTPIVKTLWAAPPPRAGLSLPHIPMPDLTGSLNDIEARLAGRALAWVGGVALVLGAIFFLSLAFSQGWISEGLRVAIGLVGGSIALTGGAVMLDRGNRLIGHVLTPVGLAIISIALIAATSVYGLVPVELGLIGALVCAVVAAFIAIRSNSQIVALFGLVSVLLAPPLMGASPNLTTLLFVATVLVGTTIVALWRAWPWLPPVAFLLSAPQAASWVSSEPQTLFGLVGIGLFWSLNVVAAGGEAFRRRRDDLSTSSATLLLANAAFVIWAGFTLLSGDLVVYRGFFLVPVALAHLGVGGYFVVRDGEQNLFGLLAIGTGIAALTMAAPIQLGASAVPIAWTAEAVALAWLAAKRGHPYSALVSGLLYALAGLYLLRLFNTLEPSTPGVPLVDASGASLGFFLAGIAAGLWFVRDRSLRSGLAAFGLVVATWCVSLVLDPPASVAVLTALTVVGVAVWRTLPMLPEAPIPWRLDGLIPSAIRRIGADLSWRRPAYLTLAWATILTGVVATMLLVGPVWADAAPMAGRVQFVDPPGAALAIYLIGLVAIAWIGGDSRLREPLAAVGLLVTAWACIPILDGTVLVAAWAVLMVGGLALWRGLATVPHEPQPVVFRASAIDWTLDLILPAAAFLTGAMAIGRVLAIELPLAEFGSKLPPTVPFTDEGAVAAMILVVAILAAGAVVGGALARRVSILVAGSVVAYAIPFEVYAWAVAVLWVALGGVALAIARVDRPGLPAYLGADVGLVIAGGAVAVGIVAPPSRLSVEMAIDPLVLVQSIIAIGAVIVGLAVLAWQGRGQSWAREFRITAGVGLVYLLSVAVVDLVATRIGGSVATDELRTQGSVALSVLWAMLGVIGFVAGLRLRNDDLRHGGLALLGLATVKVFLLDLAGLDVAYRVVSLMVLGLVLLASAWLWQRAQPRPPMSTGQGPTAG